MIDWKLNVLTQETLTFEISKLVVKFQTPVGLMDNAKQALDWCQENNMDFHLCISAVAVAIDSMGRTEIL